MQLKHNFSIFCFILKHLGVINGTIKSTLLWQNRILTGPTWSLVALSLPVGDYKVYWENVYGFHELLTMSTPYSTYAAAITDITFHTKTCTEYGIFTFTGLLYIHMKCLNLFVKPKL